MYSGQSQKCPKAEQCYNAPKSCEYCIPLLHALCNFASYPHSTEHSDHGVYMQRIYALANHRPAGNCLLQITTKWNFFL
uniref:Serine/threonine-protein kinase TOUSLED isoform X1 n=1 Tax=Rhizophora mucronata TaxID=61149 RepID=A0A2P2KC32_RHIMU